MPFVQSEAHADVQIRRFNTFIMQFDHTLILFSFQKPSTTLLVFEIWEITLTKKILRTSPEDMEGVTESAKHCLD